MNSLGTRNSLGMSGLCVMLLLFLGGVVHYFIYLLSVQINLKEGKIVTGKSIENRCSRLIKRICFHQMKRKYMYLLTGHPPGNVLDVRPSKLLNIPLYVQYTYKMQTVP